jgi:hypothetical protein
MIGTNTASECAPTSNLGLPRRRGARRTRVRHYARSRPGDRPWNGQYDWSERHYGLFAGRQWDSMSTVVQESANAQGRVTSIEVTGPTAGVHSFIDRYLQADAVDVAYNLD